LKRSILFPVFLFTCFCLFVFYAEAREVNQYNAELTVPIFGKDTAFARNNAFRTLQKQLLEIAIQDLIGIQQFEQFKDYIFRNAFQRPSNYFISVNIIKEESQAKFFTMKLEGTLQIDAIRTSLKALNLVFQSDPWHKIDLLVQKEIPFDLSVLQARLDLFHLRISSVKYFADEQLSVSNDPSSDINPLFEIIEKQQGSSNSPVVFVVDLGKDQSNDKITKIETSVFNRKSSKKVGSLSLEFSTPRSMVSIKNGKKWVQKKFIALFTHDTLKQEFFETREQNTIKLFVTGLNTPFLKDQFQEELLEGNRKIISYQVSRITIKEVEYTINTKANSSSMFDVLSQRSRGNFVFEVLEETEDQLRVTVVSYENKRPDPLPEWVPNNRILEQIRLSQFSQIDEKEIDPDVALDEELIPIYIESEPNNHRNNLNILVPFKRILGKISSRGDEDLFQLDGFVPEISSIEPNQLINNDASQDGYPTYFVSKSDLKLAVLMIEWFQFGKTDLIPQLRLYDENFELLDRYNLQDGKNKVVFDYDFKENFPQRVYIRITDQIGFIKGETGGYKSFNYLLKYSWKGMKNQFEEVF